MIYTLETTLADVEQVLTIARFAEADIELAEQMWGEVAVANAILLAYLPSWGGRTPEEVFWILRGMFMADIETATERFRVDLAIKNPQAIPSFRKRMQGAIKRYAYRAFEQGARQTNPAWRGFTEASLSLVRGEIDREFEYLRGFIERVRQVLREKGEISTKLEWNAELYGKSLRRIFHWGTISQGKEEDMVTIERGNPKGTSCRACPPRWGSYSMREFLALQPPPPPANWCLGKSNCWCILTIVKNRGLIPMPRPRRTWKPPPPLLLGGLAQTFHQHHPDEEEEQSEEEGPNNP